MSPIVRNLLIVALVGWMAYQLFDYGRTVERQACQLKGITQAAQTSEDRRAQEGATGAAREEASHDHFEAIRQLVDQRDAAAGTAERLRRQLAETQRVASGCTAQDPAAEQGRQAVAALGAVFAACEAEQRALAEAAAGHLAAGQLCEREYDALTAEPGAPASGAGL